MRRHRNKKEKKREQQEKRNEQKEKQKEQHIKKKEQKKGREHPAKSGPSLWARETKRLTAQGSLWVNGEAAIPTREEGELTLQTICPDVLFDMASFLGYSDLKALCATSKYLRWFFLQHQARPLWASLAAKLCQNAVNPTAGEEKASSSSISAADFPLAKLREDPLMLLRSRLFLNSREYDVTWLNGEYWCELDEPNDSIRGRIYHLNNVCWLEIHATVHHVPRGRYRAEWRVRFGHESAIDFAAKWKVFASGRDADTNTKQVLLEFQHDKNWKEFHPWVRQGWVLVRTNAFVIAHNDMRVEGEILGGNDQWFHGLDIDYMRLVPCAKPPAAEQTTLHVSLDA